MEALITAALIVAFLTPVVEEQPVLRAGVVVHGTIEASDPEVRTATLDPRAFGLVRGKAFRYDGVAGDVVTIEARSHFFDAYLVVRNAAGEAILEDDDGLFGTHARVVLSRPDVASVEVCALGGDTGPFVVTVTAGETDALEPWESSPRIVADAQDALEVLERAFGPDDLRLAAPLGIVALDLMDQGAFDEARSLFERALRLTETALGPDDPNTAACLYELGDLLHELGEYDEARPLLERALETNEDTLGPDHSNTMATLGALALLLEDQGAYGDARPLFERALETLEATLGPDHPITAIALNNLATNLLKLGEKDEARPLLERALRIAVTEFGDHHPETAPHANNLAALLHDLGAYEDARALYENALRVTEGTFGPDHPDVATRLRNLASLLQDLGAHDEARPLLERALRITESAFGSDHPTTASCRFNLAILEYDLGETSAAFARARRAWTSAGNHFRAIAWSMSEVERLDFLRRQSGRRKFLLSLGRSLGDDESRCVAYGATLEWKGRVGRSLLRDGLREYRNATEEQRDLIERLRTAQQFLADALYARDVADPEAQGELLDRIRSERNAMEVELARLRGEPEDGESPEGALDRVLDALPDDAAAVDLVVHEWWVPAGWNGGALVRPGHGTEPHLSAWVLGRGRPLAQFDLGPAAAVETAVREFLEEVVGRRGLPFVDEEADEDALTTPQNDRLRALLWEPLADAVGDASRIFVSSDSFLGTLPIEMIARADGTFLIEHHGFSYVTDMTSLVGLLEQDVPPEPRLLLLGGVDFRRRADAPADAPGSDERTGLGGKWRPLSGTTLEADAIADVFAEATDGEGDLVLVAGRRATEEAIKQGVAGRTHIHLATHGFFAPEGLPSAWKNLRERDDAAVALLGETRRRVTGYLPGLLSGLVLAGANTEPEPGRDNGLLTAEEVTYLDLKDCDLAVLSACETGLGKPEAGEGMIGLRRAFRMAGARTVISSLWRVRDDSTQELMAAFYENLWLRGMPKLEALRAAQLAMLERNRREYGDPMPSTWGAFVLDGAPE